MADPQADRELYLLLGRLEGKMDSMMTQHSTTLSRLDGHETRLGTLEQEVATLAASSSTGKTWLSTIIAIGAAFTSGLAFFFGQP